MKKVESKIIKVSRKGDPSKNPEAISAGFIHEREEYIDIERVALDNGLNPILEVRRRGVYGY